MYIAIETVLASIEKLRRFNPFYGITFLVCKEAKLPVGRARHFGIDVATTQFLQRFYKPDIASKHFFHPFETSGKKRGWVSPRYASTGLQSSRTREFKDAFVHEKGTDFWGWDKKYVRTLSIKQDLDKSGPVPAFWLAVWLFRDRDWPDQSTPELVVQSFLSEFSVTKDEREQLFTVSPPQSVGPVFTDQVYSDAELLNRLPPAPDARPEEGGTLRLLALEGLGPSERIEFHPGDRLSVITGDNGLGKTFLLECAWWALAGQWAEDAQQALPHDDNLKRKEPAITFEISGKRRAGPRTRIKYDWATQSWPLPKGRPTIPGLIVYARVDGSFAVWDPVRYGPSGQGRSGVLLFKRDEVFDGLEGKIEGLLRDWVNWQRSPDQGQFEVFKHVLRRLSPPDLGPLVPGEPVRLPRQPREIPTIQHHFDRVPVTQESAGVKRIVTIAYLLVWAWNEHRINSNLARKAPQKNIVLLVDEIEAHLHPKWQRVVLPALLDVAGILSKEVRPQIIIATHSPLILASLESTFSDETDKLYHLKLESGRVTFRETRFIRHGRVDEWLTSEIFQLREPRSSEGEYAIRMARKLLESDEPNKESIKEATDTLTKTLAADDEFWPRWVYFAETKGVKL